MGISTGLCRHTIPGVRGVGSEYGPHSGLSIYSLFTTGFQEPVLSNSTSSSSVSCKICSIILYEIESTLYYITQTHTHTLSV